MLQDTKTVAHINGDKVVELREGCGGRGQPIFIVVTYIINMPRTYYEERFGDINEALTWYDNIN